MFFFSRGLSRDQSTQIWLEKISKEFLPVCIVKIGIANYSHVFFPDSKFHKPFLKRVTQGTFLPNLVEIHQVVSEKIILHRKIAPIPTSGFRGEDIKNFCKSIQCKKSPPPGHVFLMDQNFTNNFWKGSPKEQSVKLFRNLTTGFRGEFFRNFLWNSIWLPWQPEFFFLIKFCEQLLKRTIQQTFRWSLVKNGKAVLEELFKEVLMPYDARSTPGDPKS